MQVKETQNFDILSLLGNNSAAVVSRGNSLEGITKEQEGEGKDVFLKLLEKEGLSESEVEALTQKEIPKELKEGLKGRSQEGSPSEELLKSNLKLPQNTLSAKLETSKTQAPDGNQDFQENSILPKKSQTTKVNILNSGKKTVAIPQKSLGSESFVQGKLQAQARPVSKMGQVQNTEASKEIAKNVVSLNDFRAKQGQLNLKQYEQSSAPFNSKLISMPKEKASHSSRDGMRLQSERQEGSIQEASAKGSESILASAIDQNLGKENNSDFNLNKSLEGIDANSKSNSQNTIDLSQIDAKNSAQLIKKVSDYITRSFVENSQTLDVMVNHSELGQFRVSAQKAGTQGAVDLEIQTLKAEGHQFFMENEVELVKSLSQSGVKLTDVKIISAAPELSFASESKLASNDTNFGQNQGESGQSSHRDSSGNRQNQQQRESERRRELWQEFERQRA